MDVELFERLESTLIPFHDTHIRNQVPAHRLPFDIVLKFDDSLPV